MSRQFYGHNSSSRALAVAIATRVCARATLLSVLCTLLVFMNFIMSPQIWLPLLANWQFYGHNSSSRALAVAIATRVCARATLLSVLCTLLVFTNFIMSSQIWLPLLANFLTLWILEVVLN